MFSKRPTSFHDASKPIIYFNWLFGLGVDRQPDLSDAANIGMQLYTIISISLNWTMIYIGLTVLIKESNFWTISFSARMMNGALICTNSCISVISPFMIMLQRKGLRDCLQQLPALDDTFQAIFGARCDYRKRHISQICQVLAIVLVTCLVFASDMPWTSEFKRTLWEHIAVHVTLDYPITVMLMIVCNFYYLLEDLRTRFKTLNDGLLRLVRKPSAFHPGRKIFVISQKASRGRVGNQTQYIKTESSRNDNHDLLHEIRRVHLELSRMSRKINHAFGIQNLVSITTSFVMVTGLLYNIYIYVIQGDLSTLLTHVIPSVLWTMIYAFKIWVVNHSCWSVSSEAQRTGEIIYELLESKVDKKLQKEIQEFGVQMLQNPVRFDACGFFTLDHTFVQGVIGSITTYLVILIQMSSLSVSCTSSAAVVQNSTEIPAN